MSLENAYKTFELPGSKYYKLAEIEMPEQVSLRHMTVKDVKYFSQLAENADLEKFIDQILKSCCKESLNWNALLDGDRVFMFYMIRALTMDNMYSFVTPCSDCGHKMSASADLFALPHKEYDESLGYPMKVSLPKAGKVADVVFPNRMIEKKVGKMIEDFLKTAPGATPPEEEYRLKEIIKSVEGFEGVDLFNFISGMHYMDYKAIEKAIRKNGPGLDLEVLLDCEECGFQNSITFSLKIKEFFLIGD